MSKSKIS